MAVRRASSLRQVPIGVPMGDAEQDLLLDELLAAASDDGRDPKYAPDAPDAAAHAGRHGIWPRSCGSTGAWTARDESGASMPSSTRALGRSLRPTGLPWPSRLGVRREVAVDEGWCRGPGLAIRTWW